MIFPSHFIWPSVCAVCIVAPQFVGSRSASGRWMPASKNPKRVCFYCHIQDFQVVELFGLTTQSRTHGDTPTNQPTKQPSIQPTNWATYLPTSQHTCLLPVDNLKDIECFSTLLQPNRPNNNNIYSQSNNQPVRQTANSHHFERAFQIYAEALIKNSR